MSVHFRPGREAEQRQNAGMGELFQNLDSGEASKVSVQENTGYAESGQSELPPPVQNAYKASTVSTRAEPDICQNRHRGNPQSIEAHKAIQKDKKRRREEVFNAISEHPIHGLTVDELAVQWGVDCNKLSGRFSELSRDGRITKIGTRLTRSKCNAAVWTIV